MHSIKIVRFELQDGQETVAGNKFLGRFQAEVNGIMLDGCALTINSHGFFGAHPPRGFKGRDGRNPIKIVDRALYFEFRDRAVATWRALTGDTEIAA